MKQMKKSVEVDVYGKCGKLKCDRSDEAGCYTQLEHNYRFYLSFENSVCEAELETKVKRRFVITEKVPSRAFSLLKAPWGQCRFSTVS